MRPRGGPGRGDAGGGASWTTATAEWARDQAPVTHDDRADAVHDRRLRASPRLWAIVQTNPISSSVQRPVNLRVRTQTARGRGHEDEPSPPDCPHRAGEAGAPCSPRGFGRASVSASPATGAAWADLRKAFHRALEAAKLEGLWFHDLRRSFVTRARKHRIPESVMIADEWPPHPRGVRPLQRRRRCGSASGGACALNSGRSQKHQSPTVQVPVGLRFLGVAGAGFEPATFGL